MESTILTFAVPLCAFAIGASLLLLLARYFRVLVAPARKKRTRGGGARAWKTTLIWFGVSRLILLAAILIGAYKDGWLNGFLADWGGALTRWDAPHYIGLAENWYVTVGDARFHIVFFPLYPLMVRLLNPIFAGDTILCATVFSNVCLYFGGWALYECVRLRSGAKPAARALRLFMLSPMSVFFSVPYTEPLFFLLTCLAVYSARREKFIPAIALGALAALTRAAGVVVAVPIFYEMLRKARREGLTGPKIVRSVCACALVFAGFAAYLALNYAVTGDAFKFMEYQRDHWSQGYSSIWNTLEYTIVNAFEYENEFWRVGTWIPQAAFMAFVIALLFASSGKVYPPDGAYAWIYLVTSFSISWLISGPRYTGALYALYPMLSIYTRKRGAEAAVLCASAALMAYFGYCYAISGSLL